MRDLLDHIPTPVLDDFVGGRWLPVIGAGLSRNAVVNEGRLPALWPELGSSMAGALGIDKGDSVIEVLSAYSHSFGRQKLVEQVGLRIRAHDAKPGGVHLAFAGIQFTDLVTTNFDTLLETAYEALEKRSFPVVDESLLSAVNYFPGPRIVKFHGDLAHPDRMVLTEDDYDSFLVRFPLLVTSVTAMFIDRTAMFLGYSLDDPDMRQMLSFVKQRLGRMARPMWTIQVAASASQVARFERRGVHVINLPRARGLSAGDVLQELFVQLQAYWQEHVNKTATATDDRLTAELLTPARTSVGESPVRLGAYRLVFFAVPLQRVGWFRENIYPVVEARGLVPVSSADVFSPEGSAVAKVDSLLGSADLVLVEMGSEWSQYEARLALELKGPSRVLLTVEPGRGYPSMSRSGRTEMLSSLDRMQIVTATDASELAMIVDRWMGASGVEPTSLDEARNLLEINPGLAVVSAITVLETILMRTVVAPDRRNSIGRLLDLAFEQEYISEGLRPRLREAVVARNQTVHASDAPRITQAKARQLLEAVDEAVRTLRGRSQ
ncbi:MAG: SIR2 family protein [Actinobacteria bacterium]|nr:SIR2 family protein [Actinomycetota bacterium]